MSRPAWAARYSSGIHVDGATVECDVAGGCSQDENENGIPDECEGEMLPGGDQSPDGNGGVGDSEGESAMMSGDGTGTVTRSRVVSL